MNAGGQTLDLRTAAWEGCSPSLRALLVFIEQTGQKCLRSPFEKRRKSVVLCSRSSGDSVPVASFPGMSHPAALRGLLHRGARGLASLSLRTGSDSSGHRGWWASASARVPSLPPPACCRCGNGRGVLSVRRDRMAPSQARGDGVAVVAARFGSVGPSGAGQGPSQAVLQLCLSAREAMLTAEDPGDVLRVLDPCPPGARVLPARRVFTLLGVRHGGG